MHPANISFNIKIWVHSFVKSLIIIRILFYGNFQHFFIIVIFRKLPGRPLNYRSVLITLLSPPISESLTVFAKSTRGWGTARYFGGWAHSSALPSSLSIHAGSFHLAVAYHLRSSRVNSILPGWKSPWTMPFWWRNSKPCKACLNILFAIQNGSTGIECSYLNRGVWSTGARKFLNHTINTWSLGSNTRQRWTLLGPSCSYLSKTL